MTAPGTRPRIAIVSPFLDKRHGTERMVIEWITRLSHEFDFHVYSQRVADVDLTQIAWHRIPTLRGPHLFNYLWWFVANHLWRARHRSSCGLQYDLVFSPGVNCLDADAVSVHIVFAELLRRLAPELKLARNSLRSWPIVIHRKLYYRLIVALERRVFMNRRTQLIITSPRTTSEIAKYYSRCEHFPAIYAGVDHGTFNPNRRQELRAVARHAFDLWENHFCLLLIGNDWRKKGVSVLLDALAKLPDLPLRLLVVSNEFSTIEREVFRARPFDSRIRFLPLRSDVETYYAAADVYTGPSLEDTFALPASEAMACGLPVIMSSRAGVAAFISDGVDGLILEDPTDAKTLASMIRELYENRELRDRIGAKAAETARQYTWEQNARELGRIFEQVIRRKSQPQGQVLKQES